MDNRTVYKKSVDNMLEELKEYFENRADVDYQDGTPVLNKEAMLIGTINAIKAAMEILLNMPNSEQNVQESDTTEAK